MFFEPWDDVGELKDKAGVGAYGVLVGLERERAVGEREALEREGSLGSEALAGAEAVGGGPFAVGDVEFVGAFFEVLEQL